MAINIPRSPISQAATQRRSLLPASEAGQVARTFGALVNIGIQEVGKYADRESKLEAEQIATELKGYEKRASKNLSEQIHELGFNEADPADVRGLVENYIDDIASFSEAQLEGTSVLTKKRLQPQIANATKSMRDNLDLSIEDFMDQYEKGQVSGAISRANTGYSGLDASVQVVKDFEFLTSRVAKGSLNPGELQNWQQLSISGIANSYTGSTGPMEYLNDLYDPNGALQGLPGSMLNQMKSSVNPMKISGSFNTEISSLNSGEIEIKNGVASFTPGSDQDREKRRTLLETTLKNLEKEYGFEVRELRQSLENSYKNQQRMDAAGSEVAKMMNDVVGLSQGGAIQPRRYSKAQRDSILSLIASNKIANQVLADPNRANFQMFTENFGGIPDLLVERMKQGIDAYDLEVMESIYQYYPNGHINYSGEESLSEAQNGKRVEYQSLRESGFNPLEAIDYMQLPDKEKTPFSKEESQEISNEIVSKIGPLYQMRFGTALPEEFKGMIQNRAEDLTDLYAYITFQNPNIAPENRVSHVAQLAMENALNKFVVAGDPGSQVLLPRLSGTNEQNGPNANWIPGQIKSYLVGNNTTVDFGDKPVPFNQLTSEQQDEFIDGATATRMPLPNNYRFTLSDGQPVMLELNYGESPLKVLQSSLDSLNAGADVDTEAEATEFLAEQIFGPENSGFAVDTFGQIFEDISSAPISGVSNFFSQLSSFIGMGVDASQAAIEAALAEGDFTDNFRHIMNPRLVQRMLENLAEPPVTLPVFMNDPEYRERFSEILTSVSKQMNNEDFEAIELSSGLSMDPGIQKAFKELKSVMRMRVPGAMRSLPFIRSYENVVASIATDILRNEFELELAKDPSLAKRLINAGKVSPLVESYDDFIHAYTDLPDEKEVRQKAMPLYGREIIEPLPSIEERIAATVNGVDISQVGLIPLEMEIENPQNREEMAKNIAIWEKEQQFPIMPRQSGRYYPQGYTEDVRVVQSTLSKNTKQATEEIASILFKGMTPTDQKNLFDLGPLSKPTGARKSGWMNQRWGKVQVDRADGMDPNASLAALKIGLSRGMPGNSASFITGLTNKQFFRVCELMQAMYEAGRN